MIHFLFSTFLNLMLTGNTGWTTAKERRDLAQAMREGGKTGYAENDGQAWERHLAAMDMPQPESLRGTNGYE